MGFVYYLFFLRFEFPDSSSFFVINSILLIIRNSLIIPYLGVLGLLNWIANTFSDLIQQNIVSEMELSIILNENNQFSAFDEKLFHHLPFLLSPKKNYSLESRRTIFSFVRILSFIPSRETLRYTTQSLFGTTLTGSVVITTFAAGVHADNRAEFNRDQAIELISDVFENPKTSPKERTLAALIEKEAKQAYTAWQNEGGDTIVYRGAKVLLSEPNSAAILDRGRKFADHAIDLRSINQLEVSLEKKQEMLSKLAKRAGLDGDGTFSAGSCIERFDFWFFLN